MAGTTASTVAMVLLSYCAARTPDPQTAIGISETYSGPPAHIALNVKSFKELIQQSDLFVDKTLLIKRVLEDPKPYFIINAPRKFGKTVNINMIKEFLQIELNWYHVRVMPKAIAQNYRLFKDGEVTLPNGTVRTLKTPLLISLHDDLIERYLGNYPVISFNLSNIYSYDHTSVLLNIAGKLRDIYQGHRYLLSTFKKNNLSNIEEVRERAQIQHEYFDKMLNARGNQEDIVNGINFLAQLLQERFSKRPFLLVDDYDNIFKTMMYNPTYTDGQKNDILKFFATFFAASFLKNKFIEKTILTGVLPLYTPELFLDNITEYSFETDMFPFYGFFVPELTALYDQLQTPDHIRQRAYHWYAGYGAGPNFNATICNPWSMVNFINKKTSISQIKSYWVDTEQIDPMMKFITQNEAFIETMLLLVGYDHVSIHTNYSALKKSSADELCFALHAPPQENFLTKFNMNLIIWYLHKSGYLTGSDYMLDYFLIVRIPNNEVRSEFARIVINYYFIEKYKLSSAIFSQTTQLLLDFLDGQNVTSNLTQNFEQIVEPIPLDQHMIEKAHIKRHVYRSVIQFLFALVPLEDNYRLILHFHEPHIPCIVIFTRQRGNIVAINYNSTEPPLTSAKKCRYAYFKYDFLREINVVKFIGVNITLEKKFYINFESEIIR